jgi:outer membrane protein assembly factor BamB
MIEPLLPQRRFESVIRPLLAWTVLLAAAAGAGCDTGKTSNQEDEAGPLKTSWKYEFSYESRAPSVAPKSYEVEDERMVLFGAGGNVVSARASGGDVKWKTELDPVQELQCREFVISESRAFCSHLEKALAWDLATGDQEWTFSSTRDEYYRRFYDLGFFALGPNHFYGSADGGWLYALERSSGKVAYKKEFAHLPRGLAYDNGAIYFGQAWVPDGGEGQAQGGILKVDPATGDSTWHFRTQRGGFYRMRPIVRDGVVYAGTLEGEKTAFYALDAETGEVLWENTNVRVYAAEWADGTIVVNDGRSLIGLDAENGQTLWRTDMPGAHGEAGIAYHDGYVYHPHAGPLAVVDVETGEVVHTEPPVRGSYYWVVGAGAGKIFAQTSGALVAFEPYAEN